MTCAVLNAADKTTASLRALQVRWHVANMPTTTTLFHILQKADPADRQVTTMQSNSIGELLNDMHTLVLSAYEHCGRQADGDAALFVNPVGQVLKKSDRSQVQHSLCTLEYQLITSYVQALACCSSIIQTLCIVARKTAVQLQEAAFTEQKGSSVLQSLWQRRPSSRYVSLELMVLVSLLWSRP